jgi:uncharacterized protein YhaN
MKISQLKQLIKEVVQDRIRMIDEAGDIAAVEAKINKVEEDIQDAMRVKSALVDMAGLKYYVQPEIISDMMDDMEASIKELQDKKKEFEEAKKQMTKPAKGAKKDKKAEDKPEELDEKLKPSMGAGAYVDDFRKSKAPQFKGKSKAKKQDMAVAAYLGAKQK